MEKYKVLDTNLFLSNPSALTSFGPVKEDETNFVVIPIEVLAELDKFKSEYDSERGYNARATLRRIQELKRDNNGTLYKGIKLTPNHILVSSYPLLGDKQLPVVTGLDPLKQDTRILSLVALLKSQGKDVELVSNDTGLLDIADALGLEANHWRDLEGAVNKLDQCYKGWRRPETPEFFRVLNDITSKKIKPCIRPEEIGIENVHPNEYLIMRDKPPFALRFDLKQGKFVPLSFYEHKTTRVTPKNVFQLMYMDALRDPNVDLVFAIGIAGTSKTFLSIDAAICQAIKSPSEGLSSKLPYSRVFITRPRAVSREESELGYLPGTLCEKVDPWFGAIYDQLYQLFDVYDFHEDEIEHVMGQEDSLMEGKGAGKAVKKRTIHILDTLYKRGRSLTDNFWVIDDAQNLTGTQIYALGTRSGDNCKMVIDGDPLQCDIRGEGAIMNSIVRANEKFKGDETSATIWFPKEASVRSRLASKFHQYLGGGLE